MEFIGQISDDVQIHPVQPAQNPAMFPSWLLANASSHFEDSSVFPIGEITIAGGVEHHQCFEPVLRVTPE